MRQIAVLFICLILLTAGFAQAAYKSEDGSHDVAITDHEWTDQNRKRQVPVKIYLPDGKGPFPVVVVSHGLGGSREGHKFLGNHWASHGYVSVHVQHIGSDTSVWKGKREFMKEMKNAAANIQNIINRPKDISFVIDQLETLNTEGRYKGKFDLKKIGMAGHSFGSLTTNMIAGQILFDSSGRAYEYSDARVKAIIPMSSPLGTSQANAKKSFGKINIPCLHMTGTKDHSPIGKTNVAQRRVPFDSSTAKDQFLIVFKDGDHMIFSGARRFKKRTSDLVFQDLIQQSSTAFLDAYLQDDSKAKKWLRDGGFKDTLSANGTLELR